MEKEKLLFLGEKIKKARKSKRLSQLNLSIAADMDRKTIYRIEKGLNEPSLASLYKISKALNHDFINEYIGISLEDYNKFHKTFEKTIYKLECKRNICKEIQSFSEIYENTNIEYIKDSCKQVLLFLKSLDNNLEEIEKRNLLIKSLNVFDKKSKNINKNNYSDFELRILMHIAMTYINIDNKKYLKLLKFVYENTKKDNSLYPIICINLANAYIIIENYKPCLEIIDNAISYYLDKTEIPNPIVYFTRSVYKRLNNMAYEEDYEKAILIASLSENKELIKNFNHAKKAYDDWIGTK
ncbi:MAG: helix-turn-helix transcriptional regulator [Peptoniphilaceae bacterium]|nr:helix-turn-helix transcriptional regulator [Peptoniphilaceae bacterium]MDY6018847.1 helix-turn-helix transcriptional regulator [Anaerococcus sp.]